MTQEREPIVILVADDDPEDCQLLQEALASNHVINPVHFVHDGEQVMDYLYHRGVYATPGSSPAPGLLLLDLKMPRKDGREVLEEIKAAPELRRLPVVVLSTSRSEEDILRTYDLGVNSYIAKPVTFEGLVAAVKTLQQYWFQIVALPLI